MAVSIVTAANTSQQFKLFVDLSNESVSQLSLPYECVSGAPYSIWVRHPEWDYASCLDMLDSLSVGSYRLAEDERDLETQLQACSLDGSRFAVECRVPLTGVRRYSRRQRKKATKVIVASSTIPFMEVGFDISCNDWEEKLQRAIDSYGRVYLLEDESSSTLFLDQKALLVHGLRKTKTVFPQIVEISRSSIPLRARKKRLADYSLRQEVEKYRKETYSILHSWLLRFPRVIEEFLNQQLSDRGLRFLRPRIVAPSRVPNYSAVGEMYDFIRSFSVKEQKVLFPRAFSALSAKVSSEFSCYYLMMQHMVVNGTYHTTEAEKLLWLICWFLRVVLKAKPQPMPKEIKKYLSKKKKVRS